MTKYNKLVRDRVIEIIERSGRTCTYAILGPAELRQALQAKLYEEIEEYLEARNAEELADILEVVFALAQANGVTEADLQKLRADKREARGGYARGLMLFEVVEDEV